MVHSPEECELWLKSPEFFFAEFEEQNKTSPFLLFPPLLALLLCIGVTHTNTKHAQFFQ